MTKETTMKATTRTMTPRRMLAAAGILALSLVACATQPEPEAAAPGEFAQTAFASPKEAAETLFQAAERYEVPVLLKILGPESKDIVFSDDPVHDKSMGQAFAAKAREKYAIGIDPQDPGRAVITTGNEDWPFPIPIVKKGNRWFFDTRAGREEILFRRIGANELDAIQICRGYVEAQKDYAEVAREETGTPQYAQKIFSTPGKRDGLYWEGPDGIPGGPISQPIAQAIAEGYSARERTGYHGYFFKVLKGQGPSAPMGRLDYVVGGIMIGGFALVAVPVEYQVTGVKSFMVSHDGIVYEKDLGPESLEIVKAMELYDPDPTWEPTNDRWPD
jgi:hypothetical protein